MSPPKNSIAELRASRRQQRLSRGYHNHSIDATGIEPLDLKYGGPSFQPSSKAYGNFLDQQKVVALMEQMKKLREASNRLF